MRTLKYRVEFGVWSRSETWVARNVPLLVSATLMLVMAVLAAVQRRPTYNFADSVAEHLRAIGADASAQVLGFETMGQAIKGKDGNPVFPQTIMPMEGGPVALIGFMVPYDQLDDMTYCMILPSYVGCYFCEPPSLAQVAFVRQAGRDDKVKKPFIEEPVLVSGTLMLYRDGSDHPGHLSQFLYVIDHARIAPYVGPFKPAKAAAQHVPTTKTPPPNRLNRQPTPAGHPPSTQSR